MQCLTLRMDPAAFMELVDLLVQARARPLEASGAAARDADGDTDAEAVQGALH